MGSCLDNWSYIYRTHGRHTVQYSTVQYSTVQYSTVQFSLVGLPQRYMGNPPYKQAMVNNVLHVWRQLSDDHTTIEGSQWYHYGVA